MRRALALVAFLACSCGAQKPVANNVPVYVSQQGATSANGCVVVVRHPNETLVEQCATSDAVATGSTRQLYATTGATLATSDVIAKQLARRVAASEALSTADLLWCPAGKNAAVTETLVTADGLPCSQ